MVKPKNKHSLSHVRHDPAHCLAPGLFRALKRGERKRSKLDVTYDYGDGKLDKLFTHQISIPRLVLPVSFPIVFADDVFAFLL